jgi:hypothetical protein
MSNNEATVWVVMYDPAKDLSDAKQYGELRAVFVKPIYGDDTRFDPVAAARSAMKDYQDGDYLLMIGDPMACGIVMEIALDYSDSQRLNVLRWDRRSMSYRPSQLNFTQPEEMDNE